MAGLGILADVLTGGAAGGITGIVGGIVQAVNAGKERKFKLEMRRLDHEQELRILEAESQRAQQLAQIEADEQERQTDQMLIRADSQAVAASYAHDSALNEDTSWVGYLRRSVRPILTYYVVIFYSAWVFTHTVHWWQTESAESHEIVADAAQFIAYLASMMLSWWFAGRPLGQQERRAKK